MTPKPTLDGASAEMKEIIESEARKYWEPMLATLTSDPDAAYSTDALYVIMMRCAHHIVEAATFHLVSEKGFTPREAFDLANRNFVADMVEACSPAEREVFPTREVH